jgi:hypothetical protein
MAGLSRNFGFGLRPMKAAEAAKKREELAAAHDRARRGREIDIGGH